MPHICYKIFVWDTLEGEIMEKRNRNISFYKAGNGKATRVNVPITWLKEMGITENYKSVEMIYDKEKQVICIKKK